MPHKTKELRKEYREKNGNNIVDSVEKGEYHVS